jgi:lipopolysaccharide export system protein LptA
MLILTVTLGPAAVPALGANPPAKPEGEFPLHITAAKLEADQSAGEVIFTGQVKAVYGDSTLYSDQLRVFFQKKPEAAKDKKPAPAAAPGPAGQSPLGELGGGKIDRIVATGSVRFVQGDRVATGQTATFYQERDEVVLVGNPQLWQQENNLKGERIIFNLKDNKMRVESSPLKRVEAHLYPSKGPGGKEGAPGPAKPQKSPKP